MCEFLDDDWSTIYFVPVVCFVVYNLGDIIGKHMAVWIQWPGPSFRYSTYKSLNLIVLVSKDVYSKVNFRTKKKCFNEQL